MPAAFSIVRKFFVCIVTKVPMTYKRIFALPEVIPSTEHKALASLCFGFVVTRPECSSEIYMT